MTTSSSSCWLTIHWHVNVEKNLIHYTGLKCSVLQLKRALVVNDRNETRSTQPNVAADYRIAKK